MPLTFDLPWEKLSTYAGRSPRPADFDRYWANALQELRGVDAQTEFSDAPFQTAYAHCSDVYFTGVGGARVHAKLVRPRHPVAPQPVVLAFHGYGGNAGSWVDKLPWAAAGYTILALDCRGQGGASEDAGAVKGPTLRGHIIRGLEGAPEDLMYRAIFLDTVRLAHLALGLPGVDPRRVATVGGSQGGALALVCAALEPRVRWVAATYPFLCDYRRVWEMDLGEGAYSELQQIFPFSMIPSTVGKRRFLSGSAISTCRTLRIGFRRRCG